MLFDKDYGSSLHKPGETGQEMMEDQPSIRDGSEDLVYERHIEISPVNLDNDPNPSPVQQTVVTTPSTSIFRFCVSPNQFEPQCHRPQPPTAAAESLALNP